MNRLRGKPLVYGLALFLLIRFSLTADEKPKTGTDLKVTAGYLGEMISHPGFSAGVELSFLQTGWNEFSAVSHFKFYYFPYYSTDLILDAGLLYQCNFPFGLFVSIEAGTGYLHYFLGAKGYDYIAGTAIEIQDYGAPMWIFDCALGLGWIFMSENDHPVGVYLKAGYMGEYPNNFGILSHLIAEAGVSLTIGKSK